MYTKLTITDRVRVPPENLGEDLEKAITEVIAHSYEGILSSEYGVILSLIKVNDVGDGVILPGDGAVYYETNFDVLAWNPQVQEVVEGKISEITEFGVFVRIGPIDGMTHVSQVMDDFVSVAKTGALSGKESNRVLKVGDVVRARIIAVSLKTLQNAKIGLTMRQRGLGKLEWIKEDERKNEPKGEAAE